ncbi:MAG: hypothetical protein PVF83_06750 [Anaerolineales bacterium]
MKKALLVLTILAVGIGAFVFAVPASAAQPTPVYPGGRGGNGRGGSGGDGTGVPIQQNINLEGLLENYMAEYYTNFFGITTTELKAREDAGETLVQIGLSLGYTQEAIFDLMVDARIAALNQAVADGLITQAEADWMISRLDNRQNGASAGTCVDDCTVVQQQSQRGPVGRYNGRR